MPQDIGPKSLKMKKEGSVMTKVSGNLRALCWDMYILTYVHSAPVEGNFTDTSGHAVKPW